VAVVRSASDKFSHINRTMHAERHSFDELTYNKAVFDRSWRAVVEHAGRIKSFYDLVVHCDWQ